MKRKIAVTKSLTKNFLRVISLIVILAMLLVPTGYTSALADDIQVSGLIISGEKMVVFSRGF